ncbi:MAG: VaFE repeat-containing surface-anchored protein [Coriobacteriales bacterium]|jgi:hypothetical protein
MKHHLAALANCSRTLIAVLVSCALVASLIPFLGPLSAPEPADAATKNCSVKIKFGVDKNKVSTYVMSTGGTAYCYDMKIKGPGTKGKTYTRYKKGTHITDYLIAKGYPNNLKFENKKWTKTDACLITQGASWVAGGTCKANDLKNHLGQGIESKEKIAKAGVWFAKKARAYKGGNAAIDGCSCILNVVGKKVQPMIAGNVFFGSLKVTKSGAGTVTVKGNSNYSLVGAKYGLYRDAACKKLERTLKIGKNLSASCDVVPKGTYYLKELSAPPGYALNTKKTKVRVKAAKTASITITEKEKYASPSVLVRKADALTESTVPQGGSTFAGIVFELAGNGKKALFKTNERGEVSMKEADGCFVSGDRPKVIEGSYVLPLGTYTITEKSAPEGYELSANPQTLKITDERDGGPTTVKIKRSGNLIGADGYGDSPVRGGLAIGKGDKAGYELEEGDAYTYTQGDASFAGAQFAVYNASAQEVAVDVNHDGRISDNEHFAPGSQIEVLTASYDGETGLCTAKTQSNELPFGTYRVVETKAPEGYRLSERNEKEITITNEDRYVQLVRENGALDEVICGGVRLEKHDAELQKSEATGAKGHQELGSDGYLGSSLSGIEFAIVNRSEHGVLVRGSYYAPGATVTTLKTAWNEDEKSYCAATEPDLLPYGTYGLVETASNASYLLTDGTEKTFKIREDGQIVGADSTGDPLVFDDKVVRGDLHLVKKGGGTDVALAHVPFLITNETTGEAHVAVTDENGVLDTSGKAHPRTDKVNANDALLEKESIEDADIVSDSGIWFSTGEDGSSAEATDERGALPYGHYAISELACSANSAWYLWNDEFDVTEDSETKGTHIELGEVVDQPKPQIGTEAFDKADDDKYIEPNESAHIVDRVSYKYLQTGVAYKLTGTLMEKETGNALLDDAGNPVTASLDFVCDKSEGTQDVEFALDASELAGKQLVVYETLEKDGEELAAHKEISSEEQTVSIAPKIATRAQDKADGDKVLEGSKACIVDTVDYEGLTPHKTYTLTATIVDAKTGKTLKDASGDEITGTTRFTAEATTGSEDVELNLDAKANAAKTLVVYESLSDTDGKVLATHNDITSKDQTVTTKEKTAAAASDLKSTPEESGDTSSAVETGDKSPFGLLACAAFAALAAAGAALAARKRKESQH